MTPRRIVTFWICLALGGSLGVGGTGWAAEGAAEGASGGSAVAGSVSLPPPDCVHKLRGARIALAAGDEEKARSLLQGAVTEYPEELAPLVTWLRMEKLLGSSAEQSIALRKTLIEKLSDPSARLAPGVVEYLLEGAREDAEELKPLEEALARRVGSDSKDPQMLRAFAKVQDRLGNRDEAYRLWKQVYAVDPTEATFWGLVGREAREERWGALRQRLTPRVAEPETPVMFRLAYLQALAELGEYDELERRLSQIVPRSVIEQDALDAIRMQSAWVAWDAGDEDRAQRFFQAVVESLPEHPVAVKALRYLYGPQESAAAAPTGAYGKIAPHVALERGAGLLAAGDFEGALPLLRTAALGMSNSEVAWFNLGLAALKAEKFVEAEESLARASRINPDRPDAYFNRGAALTELKRHEEAIEVLKKSLELDPSSKAAHYYLYQSYVGLGDRVQAGIHLKQYQDP